jgi:hypothetical protein
MKNITKTMLFILIAITGICGLHSCTKNKANSPSGENVIRYKVNGRQVEINGKWSSLTKHGITLITETFNGKSTTFNGGAQGSYDGFDLTISKGTPNNISTIVDTNAFSFMSCTVPIDNSKLQFINGNQSCSFNVSVNSANVIGGTFKGVLYAQSFAPNPSDSIIITDGYFDIAK